MNIEQIEDVKEYQKPDQIKRYHHVEEQERNAVKKQKITNLNSSLSYPSPSLQFWALPLFSFLSFYLILILLSQRLNFMN